MHTPGCTGAISHIRPDGRTYVRLTPPLRPAGGFWLRLHKQTRELGAEPPPRKALLPLLLSLQAAAPGTNHQVSNPMASLQQLPLISRFLIVHA